jgi:hypothetical protein
VAEELGEGEDAAQTRPARQMKRKATREKQPREFMTRKFQS